MGIIGQMAGFGRQRQREVEATKSALEQAHDPQAEGLLGASVSRVVAGLLETGIDGKGRFDSAARVADLALAKYGGDVEAAVDQVIRDHLRLAAASGFVTNLGGFVTLPVALPANVFGFYALATRMSAAVARLRGYDLRDPRIRSAVLLSLVGAEANDLLAKAGMTASGGRLASLATQRLPGPALMVVNKAVGFRILSSTGRRSFARFGKSVPFIGGAVGAGLDGWLLKQLADHVRTEFPVADSPLPDGNPSGR